MKHSLFLALASIRARCVHSVLAIIAIATGLAMLCALSLVGQGINDGLMRNARGIDVIVGAKGSPLQMVLSSVYQADIPTGNIEMTHLAAIQKNPRVRHAIPLAMGDSYKGWRVVGTTSEYLDLYKAQVGEGRVFDKPFEVVAGASTNLEIGQKFAAVHGFSADGDDVHDFHLYEVVGVLKSTGTVVDKLLLTPFESVQQLHAHHEEHEHEGHGGHDDHDEDEAAEEALGHQITTILLKVRSPADVINLPRQINRSGELMAANPAYEMARLSSTLGIGKNVLWALSAMVLALSAIMLFSTLASGLAARQYDLAVLRVLGASRHVLFATVIFEGIIIGAMGALVGILAGHGLAFGLVSNVETLQSLILPQSMLSLQSGDIFLVLIGALAGFMAALLPALSALRLDIAQLLARGT